MNQHEEFDVVIVGAGITGAIIAKELSHTCDGLNILILEAGTGNSEDYNDYQKYNDKFYNALAKTPNSPYTDPRFAPSPSVMSPHNIQKFGPVTQGYFYQKGPFPFLSNYNRNVGGTTLHWLGTTLRMCPNDFQMKTLYDRGIDWPLTYQDMMPYYRRAEREIGVSAEVDEQTILGITFEDDYVFPMHKIPQSYLDNYMADRLKGHHIRYDEEEYPLAVVSTPQGRNSMPNPKYVNEQTGEQGFTPKGAVGAPELGQRCEGNANCVPICPVQAKYNGMKTLSDALSGANRKSTVKLVKQSPVSKIEVDESGRVSRIHYKSYTYHSDGKRSVINNFTASGKVVVLAANAIENAKILLASAQEEGSKVTRHDQIGRNLMDHLVMLTWGYLPEAIGAYRGPGSTSGMPMVRDGAFRKHRSAFRVEIGNWGWNWPANTPESTIQQAVAKGLYGPALIEHIKHETNSQFRIGWEVEQLPEANNRITIDNDYRDDLGNYRPVVDYHMNDYEKRGALAASKMSDKGFKILDVEYKTEWSEDSAGYFEYEYEKDGRKKVFKSVVNGAGHVVGCHRMGTHASTSVVDSNQRSHEHPNLFVAGCGSFPTLATSNPTLTMAALAFRTADAIRQELNEKIRVS